MPEFPLPNLVKIDIEGAELACKEGAASALWQACRIIVVEMAEHIRCPIIEILQHLRYRFLDTDRAEAVRRTRNVRTFWQYHPTMPSDLTLCALSR
jgi:hypothetical protein